MLKDLGHLHLVLLHLPIGFVIAALALEVWTWREKAGRKLLEKLLALNAAAALVTAAAGLVLASTGDYPAETLSWHRWLGVTVAALAVLAWWLRSRVQPETGVGLGLARAALGLLFFVTVVAGHFGAILTHGPGVVPWGRAKEKTVAKSQLPEGAGREVLEKNCLQCHGPEKQKGGLRLDTLSLASQGGDSGPAWVPGEPARSEVIRRVRLPRSDEEVMPPGERRSLSAAEQSALEAWIAALPR
jgi:mono/diheme cytochrome c family protein